MPAAQMFAQRILALFLVEGWRSAAVGARNPCYTLPAGCGLNPSLPGLPLE
jgi:hypothetical protein